MIELKNICYDYKNKRSSNRIFDGINYIFEESYCYVITGKSGKGKTTLLSLISGMDEPASGEILFNGTNLRSLNMDEYRAKSIGVIFQNYNLLTHLNASENVQLALRLGGVKDNTEQTALELLAQLGIYDSAATRRVTTLSGGEQQRVAIARALAGQPEVIIADEPTGNLDVENQDAIMDIFLSIAHEKNKCVIIASHSPEVIARADRVLELK